jgi:2-polyprenyl-3-methyl-5-hydroxy-6-metoxy-1,4-benzoquinol methylase
MQDTPPQQAASSPVKGSPVAREIWESEHASGAWDYLGGLDEAGHYLAIARLCQRHLDGGSLLDIGCGTGILLGYLRGHAGMNLTRYTGIDLAGEAVKRAAARFPQASFRQFDYGAATLPGRHDGVVFNETLYCFADPLAIVDKCIAENCHAGSLLIVSMYSDRGDDHEQIWQALASRCDTMDEEVAENRQRGVVWHIRALRPKP